MNISVSKLYDTVAAWLSERGYEPGLDDNEPGLFFWLDTEIGQARGRILVEADDKPPTIHFHARLPVVIPKRLFSIVAFRLMNMNRGIRFGQFILILAPDKGSVSYRFTHLLADDQRLTHQFDFCMRQVIWFAEEYSPRIRDFLANPPDLDEEIMVWTNAKNYPKE